MRLVKSVVAATLPMFVHFCNLQATKEMFYGPNTENTVFCVEVSRSGQFIPEEVRVFHRKILCAIDMAARLSVRYHLHARDENYCS